MKSFDCPEAKPTLLAPKVVDIDTLGADELSSSQKSLQVVAILEAGKPIPFKIQAADLDLPELQGEPEDIVKEKCRLACQQVSQQVVVTQQTLYPSCHCERQLSRTLIL